MKNPFNDPRKKSNWKRIFASFLLLAFINQVLIPPAAFALTGGPVHSDVMGNQPLGGSDNVNLVSGDFHYNLPLASVPEFPLSVGFNSGGGMDQEASAYGFGFNSFSGSITRNLMGAPDDLNGAVKKYKGENKALWDVSLFGTAGVSLLDDNIGTGDFGIQAGISVTSIVGYNNYKGLYRSIGLGAGLALTHKDAAQPDKDGLPLVGVGISFKVDSRYGASADVGISALGFKLKVEKEVNEHVKANAKFGPAEAVKNLKNIFKVGVTDFSSQSSTASTMVSSLPSVTGISYGGGLSIMVPIIPGVLTVGGNYHQFQPLNLNSEKETFGFLYLDKYDRRNIKHMPDMGIEGEGWFDRNQRNSLPILQRDYFIANTLGLNGSMQFYQDEYGVVSRNPSLYASLDVGVLATKFENKNVGSWNGVNQASLNKQLDIIKLIKAPSQMKNFDEAIIKEKENVSLTDDARKWNDHNIKLKMRGDLAGEFDLSSANFSDESLNEYNLIHISGDPGLNFAYLKLEKEMPMYYPAIDQQTQANYQNPNNRVDRSTHIQHHTVGEIINAYGNLINQNGNNAAYDFNFNQSFYSHDQLNLAGASLPSDNIYKLNDYLESFNILDHIKDISTDGAYANDLIGAMTVTNPSGFRYFFNVPAFAKGTKSVRLKGRGVMPPETYNGEYVSYTNDLGKPRNFSKYTEEDEYYYPYAWLLSAIVGPDYVDFDDVPGPSDGDLGTWIKFKYIKASENYRWRAPFSGLDHVPAALHRYDDDIYNMATGEKEIYYLGEVESSTHLTKYNYFKRLDGVEANAEWNGDAINSMTLQQSTNTPSTLLGNDYLYAVSQIDLYKKHDSGDNSKDRTVGNDWGTPVSSTIFKYDYSICPGVPNNLNRYLNAASKILISEVPYHYQFGAGGNQNAAVKEGKLTLKKIQQVGYDKIGNAIPVPSTEFVYGFEENPAPEYNPSYDYKQHDSWGNFNAGGKQNGTFNTQISYYNYYPEVDPSVAEKSAQAFQLKKILLPSGGQMEVEYEASGYGYVQDKKPFAMRHVYEVDSDNNAKTISLLVDISDLAADNKSLDDILNSGEKLFGELSYYQETNDPHEEDIFLATDEGSILSFGVTNTNLVPGKTLQWITLRDAEDPTNVTPWDSPCKLYSYGESVQMTVIKENITQGPGACNMLQASIDRYKNLEQDGPLTVLTKMTGYATHFFTSDNGFRNRFNQCFGVPCNTVFPHKSFLRTPIYKNVFTGSRVGKITFQDNFQYATGPGGNAQAISNSYNTRYFYDENGDGSGRNTGVATVEPGGGKAAVIDVFNMRGASFMPSPAILYSKTTIGRDYQDPTVNANVGDVVSREKGKMVFEFFTPKDDELLFSNFFKEGQEIRAPGSPKGWFYMFGIWSFLQIKKKIKLLGNEKVIDIKIPFWLPIQMKWDREDQYHLKSYRYTDHSDLLGKPKSVHEINNSGQEISSKKFDYYKHNDGVTIYDGDVGNVLQGRPGKMDQTWSEAYYSKEVAGKYINCLLLLLAKSTRDFSYTNVKYSYVPPILKEIISTQNGIISSSRMTGFDRWTGLPVSMEGDDSYGNKKIGITIPAYWKYAQMGPMDVNNDYLNSLMAPTGNYFYLNSVQDANLLGCGLTEWSRTGYGYSPWLQAQRDFNGNNGWKYLYEPVSGQEIKDVFVNGTDPRIENLYIKQKPFVFNPYKSWSFETDLNTNGTYASFTPFDYNTPNQTGGWKNNIVLETFDAMGRVVESKNILNHYASEHFGYNFSYGISGAYNAGYKSVIFDGAENRYENNGGTIMLEENRVDVGNAQVVDNQCAPAYSTFTTNFQNFAANNPALVLKITPPAPLIFDQPFAKLTAEFSHAPGTWRDLLLYLDDDRTVKIISDKGEAFKGFVSYRDANGDMKVVFDPARFISLTVDQTFPHLGFNYALFSETVPDCGYDLVSYNLPDNNCPFEVHTGRFAFALEPGQSGTTAKIDLSNVVPGDANRAYEGFVWVHESSPDATEMIMEIRNNGTVVVTKVASLATPYVNTPKWKLLRVEANASEVSQGDEVHLYIRNSSTGKISLYDDLRLAPYLAKIQTSVLEHKFSRPIAGMDDKHLSRTVIYDDRNRPIESLGEFENLGIVTLRRLLYNEQKEE